MTRLRALAIAGVAVALALAISIAIFARHGQHQTLSNFRGTSFEPPESAADFVLTGNGNRQVHLIDRAFSATFLFFGYTHCPDVCPLAMGSLGHAYRMLSRSDASRTRIVFVTVDPKRDTPGVLELYVSSFGPHVVGLTGPPELLAKVWRAYGIQVDATSHEIGHGDEIYAIANGSIALVYPADVAAADLAHDASALIVR